MKIFWFIVIGIAGGVIGGMGMGGGTLLIPLLTLFTNTEQHVAQAINLIAFIPMSAVALFIHAKNKLLDVKYLLWVALPAVAAGVPASFLSAAVGGKSLGRYFGIFLMVLGGYQLCALIVQKIRAQKEAEKEKIPLYKSVYK